MHLKQCWSIVEELDTDQAFEVSLQTIFSALLTFALVSDVHGFPVNIFIYS